MEIGRPWKIEMVRSSEEYIYGNPVGFWSEATLSLINKTITICKVKRGKTQEGYRQIGLFGNIASTHSYRECKKKASSIYHGCMWENAKMDQQNIVALTAKVFELTKR